MHLVPFWSTAGIALAGCYLYDSKITIIVFISELLKHYLPNNNPLIEDIAIFRFVFLVCMSCLFSST